LGYAEAREELGTNKFGWYGGRGGKRRMVRIRDGTEHEMVKNPIPPFTAIGIAVLWAIV